MRKIEKRRTLRMRRLLRRSKSLRKPKMSGGNSIPSIANIQTPWFRTLVRDYLEGIDVREISYNGKVILAIESPVVKKSIDTLYNATMQEANRRDLSYMDRQELFNYFNILKKYVGEHTFESPTTDKTYVVYGEWEKIF